MFVCLCSGLTSAPLKKPCFRLENKLWRGGQPTTQTKKHPKLKIMVFTGPRTLKSMTDKVSTLSSHYGPHTTLIRQTQIIKQLLSNFRFLQLPISSTSLFFNFKFLQITICSTLNFFNFTFLELQISSTSIVFNFKLHQLQISSTWNFHLKLRLQASTSNFELQLQTSTWNINFKLQL